MERTFAAIVVPVGGNSGGGGSSGGGGKDRAALEQTIGQAYLDQINGYPVGNLAETFKVNGGTDQTVLATLTKAFGSNFDTVAEKGSDAIVTAAKSGLTSALQSEGLKVPITQEFRDMLFATDSNATVGSLRGSVRIAGS